ncbi:MAG TPA: NAD(P)/FAD-dependent oxidoreductase [Nannocystis sp.]
MTPGNSATLRDVDVVIVGAGFSGLCMAIELLRAGIDNFVVLEKADRVGGTWRDNTYPGAACDIPSHLYSFSFAPNPGWTRAYPPQWEIQDYLEQVADRFAVRPHIRFRAEVDAANFDEASATWTVRTRDNARFRARALVLGNGALHLPAYPDIPGRDSFAGVMFHSSRWDHSYDLSQKTVAIIGTGASAIQFVPQIAPRVRRLHLFQRTPPWILPKPDHPIGPFARRLYAQLPALQRLVRSGLYWQHEARILAFLRPELMRLAEPLARRHLYKSVADPRLRAALTPDYRMGCKRILISNDFYPALARDNVELVTAPIERIEPTGLRTRDGVFREVDAIILGTGFRATEYLSAITITGRDGRELNATWQHSPEAYLGITVAGFPNLYLLMGPGTGLGHNSMIFMIEAQARYARQAIVALRENNLRALDVRPAVQRAFADELQRKLGATVWQSGCTSWYQTPDGRAAALWPASTVRYWLRTRKLDLRDYDAVA